MLHRVFIFTAVLGLGVASAPGETYKTPFSVPCTDLWPSVKAILADQEHYAKVVINDEKMKADFQPKHTVHVDISGVLLQRMNHVTLATKAGACEMSVVSNYSGWGHNDEGDFRKRVADNLAKAKNIAPAAPAGATPATEPGPPPSDARKPE